MMNLVDVFVELRVVKEPEISNTMELIAKSLYRIPVLKTALNNPNKSPHQYTHRKIRSTLKFGTSYESLHLWQ